jgi:hypothetical protein
MSAPAMRSHHLQSNLAEVDRLGEERAARVRTIVGAQRIATIEAPPSDWLPIEIDIALTEAVQEVLGPGGVRSWSREALSTSLDKPFMRPLLGALRVFGVTPAGYTKLGPRGWGAIYRDCGTLEREVLDEHHILLRHVDVPPAMLESLPYNEGIAGAFEVIFPLCRVVGEVALERTSSEVRYGLTWR